MLSFKEISHQHRLVKHVIGALPENNDGASHYHFLYIQNLSQSLFVNPIK